MLREIKSSDNLTGVKMMNEKLKDDYKIELGDMFAWDCPSCKDVRFMKCVGKGKIKGFTTQRRILKCQTCKCEQSILLKNGQVSAGLGHVTAPLSFV